MKKSQVTSLATKPEARKCALKRDPKDIKHGWHFVLTLLTLGLWGLVWWWLILRAEGKAFFSGFDDAYWSHLMERDQPPAALYKMQFSKNHKTSKFDA
ncbi:hypothetical protein MSG37_07615 [Shewanella sp. 1CM18E]|uniref:hypothetical protein n=1 Tax=Shewanella sp. 1CM18E TaxID=2929169 RepID=UPI0020BE576F|nr:hypothetical protein [Shewanella sp. 1CM18E]MCK8044747.1 hypothetical protein [Shewanella sp. 1CM18E]